MFLEEVKKTVSLLLFCRASDNMVSRFWTLAVWANLFNVVTLFYFFSCSKPVVNILMECFSIVPTEAFYSFPVGVPVNCMHCGVCPAVSFPIVVSDSGGGGGVAYFSIVFASDLVVSNVQIDFVPQWCVDLGLGVCVCFVG